MATTTKKTLPSILSRSPHLLCFLSPPPLPNFLRLASETTIHGYVTEKMSFLNDRNPNWSKRPPLETILLEEKVHGSLVKSRKKKKNVVTTKLGLDFKDPSGIATLPRRELELAISRWELDGSLLLSKMEAFRTIKAFNGLGYDFNGYQVPPTPRATRSPRIQPGSSKVEPLRAQNASHGTKAYVCTSDKLAVRYRKPPALASRENSVKVPLGTDHVSFPACRDDVNIAVWDDDENSSGCTQPSTTKTAFGPSPRIGDHRIRKILASQFWKASPKLKDREYFTTEVSSQLPQSKIVLGVDTSLHKRSLMEVVNAVMGGGLRVGVLLQGKKVRDDNKTLLQTGLAHDNMLDAPGFSLEPTVSQAPPPLCNEDHPLLLSCNAPQPLTRWCNVKLRAFDHTKHRTYVDLKDKWKTLVHSARISPQQRRGEPVPQELLDRVLDAHAYWSQQEAKLK
ncbi:hypothetical protein RHMOL_Rhmol13G0099200 [Rhododendron molle]|uniref:Uncharacterized protein n=1 Tax=Rhododendron molle TaxID=49168 RepID=A0ACC0L5K1_RHOML|nr:hypothetical protein RHMOL_Rhmol13G0099200 [Rhododendron molle]